jgi:sugar/nucleoside kinase (ribokinase family)
VTLGDLVEDVVVELGGPINVASDTDARIHRRRGGSAANVAVAAARLGAPARFIGQVGRDVIGDALLADLGAEGVDVAHVRREGRTATIVLLVDESGERTMLVDRGSARDLDVAEARWLRDADEPIASTSRDLAAMAHERGVDVSVDVSSVALIETGGVATVLERVRSLDPSIVFANADEAAVLAIDGSIGDAPVIVKRGADPCRVFLPDGRRVDVPALPLDRTADTTGAGDAFAAGVLTHDGWRDQLVAACESGHRAAHSLLVGR